MESELLTRYQDCAAMVLERNKSLLDILTKLQSANARVARSVIKAATVCGCIEIRGSRPAAGDASRVSGRLCEDCRSGVEAELGEAAFYTASLCNALGLSCRDIILRDLSRTDMMGPYTLR